jgi:hypothetical protein
MRLYFIEKHDVRAQGVFDPAKPGDKVVPLSHHRPMAIKREAAASHVQTSCKLGTGTLILG